LFCKKPTTEKIPAATGMIKYQEALEEDSGNRKGLFVPLFSPKQTIS